MKTFDDYWKERCTKQPELLNVDRKMTITVFALRKALKKAWDASDVNVNPFGSLLNDLQRGVK